MQRREFIGTIALLGIAVPRTTVVESGLAARRERVKRLYQLPHRKLMLCGSLVGLSDGTIIHGAPVKSYERGKGEQKYEGRTYTYPEFTFTMHDIDCVVKLHCRKSYIVDDEGYIIGGSPFLTGGVPMIPGDVLKVTHFFGGPIEAIGVEETSKKFI